MNEKHPIPLWLWGIGALGLLGQQAGYQLVEDHELVTLLSAVFLIGWMVLYFRKRKGL